MGYMDVAAVTELYQEVNVEYYLREYDDLLLGRRKSFSSSLMSKTHGSQLCAELLKVIFERYLHWTPIQVRDCLDQNYIKLLKLDTLINRLSCPPEVDRRREFYYVAWNLYPSTINVTPEGLIAKLYKEVVTGDIPKYPKGYFEGNDGRLRAKILFKTMANEYLPRFANKEELYAFFASNRGSTCLNNYKLGVPLREYYDSPLDYLHDALSERQKDWDLYEKYSKMVSTKPDDTHVNFSDYTTPLSQIRRPKTAQELEAEDADAGLSICMDDVVVPTQQSGEILVPLEVS